MKSKKGQLFAGYLVLLTIAMISLVILMYLQQQGNANTSMISPVKVLEVRDKLEIFEIFEKESLSLAAVEANKTKVFGNSDFIDEFRKEFFNELKKNPKYVKDFLLENLTVEGKEIPSKTVDFDSFLKNILYPRNEMYYSSGDLIINRAKIGKKDILKAEIKDEKRFDFGFNYEFKRSCKINKNLEVFC